MGKIVRAPLYDCLTAHEATHPVSFHVPGHRNGEAWQSYAERSAVQERLARFGGVLSIDVTEISATDDLHSPDNVIAEAQQMAARVFGADESMLLVGGSTSGNIAMILTVCEPGDIILVQRNVHKSVLNGLRLAGAQAVFLQPAYEPYEGTVLVPLLKTVEQALQRYPEARAVMLSTPNYYGRGVSIKPYVELVHSYGIPLLVDEAHGAHYGLHDAFPESAIVQGADAVVQSTHKTLPAMTMGAMLHIREQYMDIERLRDMLAAVQSSSPSFPIMASLDIARAMIEEEGPALFESGLSQALLFRQEMKRRNGRLAVSAGETSEDHQVATKTDGYGPLWNDEVRIDPLRMIIRDESGVVSGYELLSLLEKYGCWAEMADEHRVLLLFGPFVSREDTKRLLDACEAIEEEFVKHQREQHLFENIDTAKSPHEMQESYDVELKRMFSEPIPFSMNRINRDTITTVPLHSAEGSISAETITPYPPGIPLVYAGERLEQTVIARLAKLVHMGAKCQGASDPTLQTIRIMRQAANIY
ncbi:arginine/lysine/ornithine decarboxylase [Paenibacillus cellulosilyticus]|uniref:Arginine/lysine/ornithine decarboxylase n=1 Tax=Paenibacillus cellulosilyticus TaxID=375489 RepID=A0A2V2YMX2_9BACL|nr:aminotransferase class I/II-fold pyridoxal phosphate-dependent enzyme [Paenibacillus cellulosilyticus]PWV95927.1 arginine/lysine/ornithine decarboxylase [Paenibacillus cellulosilyticus]QKS48403.1 aminotransferase class I/II-fold pyridoxal phosphate-dependent enzyme [Paenibacillus cellulosilyticus]